MKSNKKRDETLIRSKKSVNKNVCPHKNTVAVNEEGHAGIYCRDCGEQLEKEV